MSTVHDITDAKKSRKFKLPSKKTVMKTVALTIFGGAVAIVAVDKLTHNDSQDDSSETETD